MVRKNRFTFEELYPYMPVSKVIVRSATSSFRSFFLRFLNLWGARCDTLHVSDQVEDRDQSHIVECDWVVGYVTEVLE